MPAWKPILLLVGALGALVGAQVVPRLGVPCAVPCARAGALPTRFHLSASPTDPLVHSSAPFAGERTLYLWVVSSFDTDAYEFHLAGTLAVVDLVPLNEFVNTGTPDTPYLSREDCVWGDELIAALVVNDAFGAGGGLCFEAAPGTQRLCAKGCRDSEWWQFEYFGFATEGIAPCAGWFDGSACRPVSTAPATWGGVKAAYRGGL
jgi:hypothetical protein